MTSTFKKWYDKHKVAYNEKRKQRYHNDPEYRDKIKQSLKDRYWAKKKGDNEC